MKWREPWRQSLRRQAPLRLLSREHMRHGLIWTAIFIGLFMLSLVSGKVSLSEAVHRFWIAPVFGFGIATIAAVGHWLSPIEVGSGPRGIVRSKGEALALVPWSEIRAYRFHGSGAERILELDVSYLDEPERLYLSPKVDVVTVEEELRSYVREDS